MGRRPKLTPESIEAIVKRIRVGVYPYIAARAAGIPKSTFYDWMRIGGKGRKPYSELSDKVLKASSIARSHAEFRVFQARPFEWLRYGPGRERPDEPGWTETPQTLRLEGGDTPIQVQSEAKQIAPLSTLAEALAILEGLGYFKRTEAGEALFRSLPSPEGSGEVIDADSSDDGRPSGEGYLPGPDGEKEST